MESRDRCVVAYDNGSRGEAGEASECPSSCGGGGRGMEREAGRIRVWVENGERRRIADRTTGIVCDWGAAVIGWGGGVAVVAAVLRAYQVFLICSFFLGVVEDYTTTAV
jgi:hypothetical protein